MEHQFTWATQFHTTSENLSTTMVFPSDHQSANPDSTLFNWALDDQIPWSAPDACPPKRLKLEERLQDVQEKQSDLTFQPCCFASCFQPSSDLAKDSYGFSYFPQSYLSYSGQQATLGDGMEETKSKPTDRFYDHPTSSTGSVYPQTSQFTCYPNAEGSGFFEGVFNTSASANMVTPPEGGVLPNAGGYETSSQYGFEPATGHFLAPASFFSPVPTQPEGITSNSLTSLDPHVVGVTGATKLLPPPPPPPPPLPLPLSQPPPPHHQSQHNHDQHSHPQPPGQSLEQHRNLEETASISSNSSVTGAGGITTSAYFWQYNAQCKGPKAVRLINGGANSPLSTSTSPLSSCYDGTSGIGVGNCSIAAHSLPQYPLVVFEDPVQKRNDLVHCSKLRRGDGNDVTPNILRLRSMGDELDRLAAQITRQGEIIMAGGGGSANNGGVGLSGPSGGDVGADLSGLLTPGAFEVEVAAPPSWRVEEAKREKNKLASKICRLKKKAFHESNKIKYTGLGLEYKELASLITNLKKIVAQRVSPSLARLLQQPEQVGNKNSTLGAAVNNGGEDGEKASGGADSDQTGGLFARAKWLVSTTHVTRVAGRMDAFVEEVLNLAKTTQAKHPLIKRLSTGCNNTVAISGGGREVAAPAAPKFSPTELSLSQLPSETPESSFTYTTPNVYEYAQRPAFPAALDLSSMIRSGSERFTDYHHPHYDGRRQSEWTDYSATGIYSSVSMGDETVYDTTAYITAYHPQVVPTSPQEFPAPYPPQFYDSMGSQSITAYQNLQQVSGKVTTNELSVLPVSTDVSNTDNGIGVSCPQRLSVIT